MSSVEKSDKTLGLLAQHLPPLPVVAGGNDAEAQRPHAKKGRSWAIWIGYGALLLFCNTFAWQHIWQGPPQADANSPDGGRVIDAERDLCPQAEVLVPEKNGELWESLGRAYGSDVFVERAVGWLSGAVQVP